MADITTESIVTGGNAPLIKPSFENGIVTENAFYENQEKILNASTEEYQSSMLSNAAKSNTFAKAFNYTFDKLTMFEEDKEWQLDDEEVLNYLEQSKLPIKYAEGIKNTKSRAEFIYRMDKAIRENNIDSKINQSLSQNDRVASSVGGALLDVDLLLGVGVGAMYSKSASMAKIMAFEAGAEASISATHYMFDENYTVHDGIVDAAIGLGIAYTATKAFKALDKSPESIKAKHEVNDNTIKGMSREDAGLEPSYDKTDIVDGKVVFVPDDVSKKPTVKYADNVPEGKTITGDTFDSLSKRTQYEKNRGETIKYFTKVFSDDKYNNVNANRRVFFAKQSKIMEDAKTSIPSRIKLVSDDIANKTNELAKQNKALQELGENATSRQISYRKSRISKLEKEVSDLKQKKYDYENGTIGGKTPEQVRFMNMVDDIAMDLKATIDDIEVNVKGNNTEWMKNYKDVVEALANKYPAELNDLRNLMRSKLNNKTFENPNMKIGNRKLTNKDKAFLAALGLFSGSSAMAGEYDLTEEITYGILAIGAIYLFGGRGVELIKNKNFQNSMKNKYESIKGFVARTDYKNSPEGERVSSMKEEIAESIHTKITSTISEFQKIGGEVAELAEKLMYSAKNGSGLEDVRKFRIESALGRYLEKDKELRKQFQKEIGKHSTKNIYDDLSTERQFRRMVTDYMEQRTNDFPDSVKEFGNFLDGEFDAMYKYAQDNGVFGFVSRKLKNGKMSAPVDYKKGMIARLWKGDIHDFVRKMDRDTDIPRLKKAVADAIKANLKTRTDKAILGAERTADKMVERWISGSQSSTTYRQAGNIFDSIEHLLKDDVEFQDMLDAMNVSKDKVARAKSRIDMNMYVFNDTINGMKVTIDGDEISLSKEMFVERDIRAIFDKVSNDLYSAGALASAGFKSVKQLETTIDRLQDSGKITAKQSKTLHEVKDVLLGRQVGDFHDGINEASMIAKDVVMATKLPFAALSTTQEMMNLLGNHGLIKGLQSIFSNILGEFGKDSELVRQLSEVYGMGTNIRRTDFTYYGISDDLLAVEDAGVSNAIRKGTMKMRDFVLLPLGHAQDIIERANSSLDVEMFAKKIMGIDESKGYRWDSISLSDKDYELFKDSFEFNNNGRLKRINMDKWSSKKKDRLGQIVYEMSQITTLRSTIGETPMAMRTDSLARLVTTLMGYSINQFNVHSVEGVRHMDRTAFTHTIAGFAGSYLSLHARYAIQDKEVDDDKILMYSIMNTPFLAPINIASGLGNPVVFQMTNEISKVPMSILGTE